VLMMIDDSSNDDLADIALRIGRVCPCVPPPAATAAGINDRLSLAAQLRSAARTASRRGVLITHCGCVRR